MVLGDVGSGAPVSDGTTNNRQPVSNATVFARGGTVSGSLTIEESGAQPLLQPGRYVLFLARSARTDGVTTYYVADGLRGAFPVVNATLRRYCLDQYGSRVLASGPQDVPVNQFRQEVAAPPATVVSTKPAQPPKRG